MAVQMVIWSVGSMALMSVVSWASLSDDKMAALLVGMSDGQVVVWWVASSAVLMDVM